MRLDPKKQIEILSRGVSELISKEELEAKLKKGRPLRVKLGFDPTIADLHLGHTVVMQKLRQFQKLGHQVIFLIGDYTARIGDPSGRSQTRPALTRKEVQKNAKTYLDQAFHILDKKKTLVRRNSQWLDKIKSMDLIQLGSKQTVARMLERQDFKERIQAGQDLSIYEFYYPLLQAYDSVILKADVELGGMDQKFNLLLGRQVQQRYGQEPQVVMLMPLLLGTDGIKKMSKSFNNYIGIAEPPQEIFGKVMSLTDPLMYHYYELLTDENLLKVKAMHPKEAKVMLAKKIIARFYSEGEAQKAFLEFEKVFAKKEKPSEIKEFAMEASGPEVPLVDCLQASGLAPSKSEARRLIGQNAVRVDDARVSDVEKKLTSGRSYLLQVGKRRFLKVTLD